MLHLLLIEDHRSLATYVRKRLEEEGYAVTVCFDGASGLRTVESKHFDLVILDIMLPFMDGIQVTKRMRLHNIRVPVLMLTGRDAPQDVVSGLDAGADDYLTKPFAFDVLLARIRARTRPDHDSASAVFRFADLTVDTTRHEAWRGTRKLKLTPKEFSILECLVRSSNRIVTRERLADLVWGEHGTSDNNLDVCIQSLRQKVEPLGSKSLIHTERGVGYRLMDGA